MSYSVILQQFHSSSVSLKRTHIRISRLELSSQASGSLVNEIIVSETDSTADAHTSLSRQPH